MNRQIKQVKLVFVFLPKITLPRVLCGKEHCHDEKIIWPTKDLVFLYGCAAVNVKGV
jgi:hypothetical protein